MLTVWRRTLLGILAASGALLLPATATATTAPMPWANGCAPALPGKERTSLTCGADLVDGRAVAPPNAPAEAKEAIAAANRIVDTPYIWGGGHRSWWARGYDCSGAVGFALHGAGLLETTMVSGQLAGWESPGAGRWITVHANFRHVYMVVAGLRFDTRGNPPGVTGPRWHREMVDPSHFDARHPAGL